MFKRRALQARLFIEQTVIQLPGDGLQGGIKIGKIGNPAYRFIGFALPMRTPNSTIAMQLEPTLWDSL